MRRALASFIIALVSFPAIDALLRANSAPDLPECCRRHGEHHCVMAPDLDSASSTEPAVRAIQSKCPYYPATTTVALEWNGTPAKNLQVASPWLLNHPAVHSQIKARYRVSFSRSRQKRGPPSLLS